MDQSSDIEIRRKELWDSDEYSLHTPEQMADPKHLAALSTLATLREKFIECKNQNDIAGSMKALARANRIWSLMASEVVEWMQASPFRDPGEQDADDARDKIQRALSLEDGTSALHRHALDPSVVVMPRSCLLELRDAFEALSFGEIKPLIEPSKSGRHSSPWTWDQHRARALEHVSFLEGQGVTKEVAQARVSAAMKRVSANTLRDWEMRGLSKNMPELPDRLKRARRSGYLKVQLSDNPEFGSRLGETINSDDWKMLQVLDDNTLKEFGAQYAVRFGARHNTLGAGD